MTNFFDDFFNFLRMNIILSICIFMLMNLTENNSFKKKKHSLFTEFIILFWKQLKILTFFSIVLNLITLDFILNDMTLYKLKSDK
jgi:hypothetical protein